MSEMNMETRVNRLEGNYTELSTSLHGLGKSFDEFKADVSRHQERTHDAIHVLINNFNEMAASVKAAKPISYVSVLTAVIGTATTVSMIVAAIFFLVDARVGAATTRANTFVSAMTEEGKIFVILDRLGNRLDRMERAIEWKASVVSSETAARGSPSSRQGAALAP